ncbi:MAG: tRNA (adenosine(37)-N6)-threonylcarbamoyltransferase complex dimerization subunit type 1 TsaB [Pseudomonadota bacterium]
MRVLAIETASEACSVALFEGQDLIAHDYREIGRGHAEQLLPMISQLPEKGKAERILVSLGPGSFTGARIGIAAARALGFAWDAEVLGYPTLALVAAMAQARHRQPVTVCVTGGHGEWFIQNFNSEGQPEAELASLTPAIAKAQANHTTVCGSKAQELANISNPDYFTVISNLPDASGVTRLPHNLLTRTLKPIYGRAPDAKPQPMVMKNKVNST